MADLDWFPVEPGRYLKNTLHLTARQHGAYLLWIFAAFEARGELPGTDAGLMSIGKLTAKEWKEDGPILKAFLTREGEKWVHEFARHLRADAEVRVAGKSRAGKAGAEKRWNGRRKGVANGSVMVPLTSSHRQTDAQLQEEGQRQETVTTTLPATPSYAHALPDDWKPSEENIRAAKIARPDLTDEALAKETIRFGNHAKANNRTAFNWGPNWVNWMMKADAPKSPKPTMQTVTDTRPEDWAWRVEWHRDKGMWNPSWGPEPGQPGCFVPKEFLQ